MKYVVTIARTYGSGGKEIGKLLAKELGIKYYGREIFEMSQGVESDLDSGDDESIHNASLEEADARDKLFCKLLAPRSKYWH